MSENENIEPAQEHQVGCTCGCDPAAFQEYKKEMTVKIIISAVFFAAGYVISEFTSISSYVYLICFAISYIAVGFGVIRDALMLVGNKNFFNEYLLISVVSIGALAIKEYHEGCAVMLLFAIGDFLQSLAVSKSQDKINNMFAESDVSDDEVENEESNLSHLENEVNGSFYNTIFNDLHTDCVLDFPFGYCNSSVHHGRFCTVVRLERVDIQRAFGAHRRLSVCYRNFGAAQFLFRYRRRC